MPERLLSNARNRPSTLQEIQLTAHQLPTTETEICVSMEELWFHFFIHNDDNLKQNKNSYLNENEIIEVSLHVHLLICIIYYIMTTKIEQDQDMSNPNKDFYKKKM